MMDKNDLKEIIKAFDDSKSVSLELKEEGFCLKLKKAEAISQAPAPAPAMPAMYMPGPAPVPFQGPAALGAQPSGTAGAEAAKQEQAAQVDGELVKAPLVGVFYASPSPDEPPYVKVGDSVKKGQILCLIEAMKMMNEVKAPVDGVVREIYAENQAVIGFDDPLFLIGEA